MNRVLIQTTPTGHDLNSERFDDGLWRETTSFVFRCRNVCEYPHFWSSTIPDSEYPRVWLRVCFTVIQGMSVAVIAYPWCPKKTPTDEKGVPVAEWLDHMSKTAPVIAALGRTVYYITVLHELRECTGHHAVHDLSFMGYRAIDDAKAETFRKFSYDPLTPENSKKCINPRLEVLKLRLGMKGEHGDAVPGFRFVDLRATPQVALP